MNQGRMEQGPRIADGGAGVPGPNSRPTEETGPEDRPGRFLANHEGGGGFSNTPRRGGLFLFLSSSSREKDQKDHRRPAPNDGA